MLTLYLTPVIDKFKELYPYVKVAVREGPSLQLIEDLLDFEFDVCLVGTLKETKKGLQVLRISQVFEPMVLVANPSYPFPNKGKVKWENLVDYPLIIQPEGSIAREAILEHFRRDCRKTLFLTLFLSNLLHLFLPFQISFTNGQKCGIS